MPGCSVVCTAKKVRFLPMRRVKKEQSRDQTLGLTCLSEIRESSFLNSAVLKSFRSLRNHGSALSAWPLNPFLKKNTLEK